MLLLEQLLINQYMVSNANANNIPAYSLHSKFVENIMDSMVLWYDIKRQGATNESMSQKPVLRDLSGNGHNATCYNFAWTKQSGISTTAYPNAIVSDGVDDYAQVTGLPILTDYHLLSKEEVSYEIDSETLTLFKKVNNTEYSYVPLYSLLLFNRTLTQDEIEWVKTNLIEGNDDDADWYGVEFYTTSPNPDCIRIGNPELHKTLPVHNQMKGCLLADEGTVNKYLNESDWTSETLDGSQGQVMVEMPKQSYWKFETDGNIRRVKFSTKPLPGFKPTPKGYVSAYEASLQRSTNKLSSVVNADTDYRGGNNNAEWDGTYRSLLGMPATQISRTSFRDYARNRKADSTEWNCMTYDFQKLLYWLFVVEYGTLNSQKAFNADKDANGYAQGGLGNGVTNISYTKWLNFNGVYPLIPCGCTNSLGNGTGQIAYTMPFEYEASGAANYAGEYSAETAYTDGQFVSQGEDLYECIADAVAGTALTDTTYFKKVSRTVTYVPRYRGIENPFGHLWQWTDGINIRISPTTENGGDNLSKVFVCSDPSQFKDNGYDGYTYVGDEARTKQYVKEVIFGEGGEIMPKVVGDGASSNKYFCDYHYMNIPATETLRGVMFGGPASDGAYAGFASASSDDSPSYTSVFIGSRLCFIPTNN